MGMVTIQVIEGLERGQVYEDLPLPVRIGREDDNTVRLNDERVSRFHAKIQEDGNRMILTDLDSTNGTRVNGHPVQMRVLQLGDQLSIGRCLLVFGSREEIARRQRELQQRGLLSCKTADSSFADSGILLSEAGADGDVPQELFPEGLAPPPQGLRPLQRAEFSDAMAYVHEQIHRVIQGALSDGSGSDGKPFAMHIGWPDWQRLLKLEMDLAIYLRKIAEPDEM